MKELACGFFAATVLCLLAAISIACTEDAGTWRTLTPMPTPRTEVAVAELNGQIYVIGGLAATGSVSDKVEVYNPLEDSWHEAPPLPDPRHHAAALGYGDSLLVIGGFAQGFEVNGASFDDPKASVFEYSELNGWTEKPPLQTARGAHAVLLGEWLVAVGGAGRGPDGSIISLASAEWMDSRSDVWREFGAPLQVARDHLAAASVTLTSGDVTLDRLYVIGGRSGLDSAHNLDTNEAFSGSRDFVPLAPMPTARSGIAAVELGGRIYVFGGEDPNGTFATVEAYDPETDTWETLPPMPTARHGLGAAVVGGVIYVIGGGPEPGLSVGGANEAFTP